MDNKVFLFPLPNSTLYKKVTLPFHIFEDRYRKMVHDSIAHEIPIAIVSHKNSLNYKGEICVAGLPHILTTYEDGRMDIYITGSVKCRLTDFDQENPYKVYGYTSLEEDLGSADTFSLELESLRLLLERWAMNFLPDPRQRESFSMTLEDPEVLVNYCAIFLLDSLSMKRAVMEAETMEKKLQILLHVIGPKEISLGPFLPTLKF